MNIIFHVQVYRTKDGEYLCLTEHNCPKNKGGNNWLNFSEKLKDKHKTDSFT